jgi:pyrroline-5-carboxylate reductase
MNKILFIGGGKMMQAIAGGLLARGTLPDGILAVEPDGVAAATVAAMGIRVFPNGGAALAALTTLATVDAVVLAVKPQMMREALAPFRGKLGSQLVLSIAAGVRVASLIQWLDSGSGYNAAAQMVRAMPNTPALIGAGISGLFAAPGLSPAAHQRAEALLATVGEVVWFAEESMLDSVTAVSGSGPAYVFYFIEALEDAALKLGFEAAAARKFALQTFRGAALLAAQSSDAPHTLRANVTSRNGTTEAAIKSFDEDQLKPHFIEGVCAAALRACTLGDELSNEQSTD